MLNKEDKLYVAETENRHLKDTIAVLREKLELLSNEKAEAVRKAVSSANDEILQLRTAIVSLRDELELMSYDKQQSVQEAWQ